MTEKLDPYAQTPEILFGIKHQLLRAGIPEEDIPMDWVAAIAAAMTKFMLTTEDGLKLASKIFKFQIKKAEDIKEYTLVDNINTRTYTLKNAQVWFYEGCIVNGMPVPLAEHRDKNFIPPLELEITDLTKNKCDGCGIVSHCTQEVLDPTADQLLSMCNFCRTYHEHPRVNELGGLDACQCCSEVRCGNHPGKKQNMGWQRTGITKEDTSVFRNMERSCHNKRHSGGFT